MIMIKMRSFKTKSHMSHRLVPLEREHLSNHSERAKVNGLRIESANGPQAKETKSEEIERG